jgi:hypothetical protein
VVEQDHRGIKRRVNASQGFRSFDGAWRSIQGYEVLRMIRKGQVRWLPKGDVLGRIQFIREILGVKAEYSADEIGGWFGFADRIVFATQPLDLHGGPMTSPEDLTRTRGMVLRYI